MSNQGMTYRQRCFRQSLVDATSSFQSLHGNHSISVHTVEPKLSVPFVRRYALAHIPADIKSKKVSHLLVRETTVNLCRDNRCLDLVANQATPESQAYTIHRCSVRISARTPAILTEVFSGLP
jgi:hypothetical protein